MRTSLDTFRLKAKSPTDLDYLPHPEEPTGDIVTDLQGGTDKPLRDCERPGRLVR